jgi:hypothetical protein
VFPPHVTVEADNLTFSYFSFYRFDRPTFTDHHRNVKELLSSHMVKGECQYIGVPTVNTWMSKKVLIDIVFSGVYRITSPFVV